MVRNSYLKFIETMKRLVSTGAIPIFQNQRRCNSYLASEAPGCSFRVPICRQQPQGISWRIIPWSLGTRSSAEVTRALEERWRCKDASVTIEQVSRKVLVVGAHANDIGLQCRGWTMSWQGSKGATTKGTTLLGGIGQVVSKNTEVTYQANPHTGYAKGKGFEYAIVVVGEKPYAEIQGDNLNNVNMPAPYLALIKDTCSNVPCVLVMISGRPLVVEPYLGHMNAFVVAWLPGSEGRGVAEVLFGNYEFTGKLSRTWFRTVGQLPMNVGDKFYSPLFPFGFGLKMGLKQ